MMSRTITAVVLCMTLSGPAAADNLYRGSNWSSMSADRRATDIGDALTVVIFQAAESSNLATNSSRKATDLSGSISGGHLSESGELSFGGGDNGPGEGQRHEKALAPNTP